MVSLEDVRFQRYTNSTPVCEFNGVECIIEDLVKAFLVSGQSFLLGGERGDGKTLILEEVNSWFNNEGIYLRASPDMDVKYLFQRFDMDKVSLELNDKINAHLSLVDEGNRAPPVIQNQIFNLTDGYLEFNGEKVLLGKTDKGHNYHVCASAMNLGNGDYLGTFDSDAAFFDRFVTINLDYFFPKNDILNIVNNNSSTSSSVSEVNDYSSLFIRLSNPELINGFFSDCDLAFFIGLGTLIQGLDHCSRGSGSKRVNNHFVNLCEGCHGLGNYCGQTKSLSIRKGVALKRLYYGLNKVCESKGASHSDELILSNLLSCFKVVAPYAGVLDKSLRDQNPYEVISQVNKKIGVELNNGKDQIQKWISFQYKSQIGDSSLPEKPVFNGLLSFLNDYEG